MIYVLLLENVITQKRVHFIGHSPVQYDDIDLLIYFTENNLMTSVNYNYIETVQWFEGDEKEALDIILRYIDMYGRNDQFGRYNVIWDSNIVCDEIFYMRIKQIQRNGNPFL